LLFVRELQQRQQLTAQLHQAQRDLHAILDNLPSMISYWDSEQRNRFVNQSTSAMFGHSPEAVRGMLARELLGEKDYALVRPYLEQALEGRVQVFERTLTDAKGQKRHMQVSYTPDRGG